MQRRLGTGASLFSIVQLQQQLQQQCRKRHQGAAAGIILLPVAGNVTCSTACWCAGAAVCTQGPRCHCPPQRAAGRRAEPRLSACHERHPKIPAAEVRPTLPSPMDLQGPRGVDCCPCVRCWRAGAQLWELTLHLLCAAHQCTPVCHTRAGLSVATSCRRQLCWAAAWWHTRCVRLNACKQAARDFEALSCRQQQT